RQLERIGRGRRLSHDAEGVGQRVVADVDRRHQSYVRRNGPEGAVTGGAAQPVDLAIGRRGEEQDDAEAAFRHPPCALRAGMERITACLSPTSTHRASTTT